jgi:hypothetical protein
MANRLIEENTKIKDNFVKDHIYKTVEGVQKPRKDIKTEVI